MTSSPSSFSQVVLPTLQDLDVRIVTVHQSQMQLSKEVESIIQNLKQVNECDEQENYSCMVQKLNVMRRRLTSVNATLAKIHHRIDRVTEELKHPSPTSQ